MPLVEALQQIFKPAAEAQLVKSQDFLRLAQEQYPYLKQANLSYSFNANPDAAYGRQLEYWAPGTTGFTWQYGEARRPSDLPLYSSGVEVFNPNIRPIDLLADYVSHEAVNTDPKLNRLYNEFASTVPDAKMMDRYNFHRMTYGEDRTFEDWKRKTGLPEFMRGYTFNQWPNAESMYTPAQLKKLDEIKQHVGVK